MHYPGRCHTLVCGEFTLLTGAVEVFKLNYKKLVNNHLFLNRSNPNQQIHQVSTDLPDVVKWLSLVDYDAACWTPVAVEKVLHDAAFANLEKTKHISVSNSFTTLLCGIARPIKMFEGYMDTTILELRIAQTIFLCKHKHFWWGCLQ